MRAFARAPLGDRLYRIAQKRFGTLTADPQLRLESGLELAEWAAAGGVAIEGATVVEVGTGHKPIVPIALFLLGAQRVLTYDLHRRLDVPLMARALAWIATNPEWVMSRFAAHARRPELQRRLDLIARLAADPLACFGAAGIEYHAPADAARTGLPAGSVQLHVSVTVLEHIPPVGIESILHEARRILAPSGLALHFVDPSDHFSHADPAISPINFLRFPDAVWQRIGGNEFAYCNRLRRTDYDSIFERCGLRTVRQTAVVDARSLEELERGFPLDPSFVTYDRQDICTVAFKVALQPQTSTAGAEAMTSVGK